MVTVKLPGPDLILSMVPQQLLTYQKGRKKCPCFHACIHCNEQAPTNKYVACYTAFEFPLTLLVRGAEVCQKVQLFINSV